MIQKEVTAQVPEKKNAEGEVVQTQLGPATVLVDYPEGFEEALEMFGEEPVLSNAFGNWRVVLQGNIRAELKAGNDQDAIQSKLGGAKMGVAQAGGRVDVQTAFIAKFKTATPDKQAEMLEMLRGAAQE